MRIEVLDTLDKKRCRAIGYNYIFDKSNGTFLRWGKTKADDPSYAPSPELVDMEISTICSNQCDHCYKSNTVIGKNMDFETFKKIFDKLPKTVCQIAYGIGDIKANPDLFKIFEYTRDNGIIPNVTINGVNLDDKYAKELARLCGAVSVSRYKDIDICYNTVRKLLDYGLKQVNIHQLLAQEILPEGFRVINDCKHDTRLTGLNAVVFLALKPKGDRNKLTPLKNEKKFKSLIDYAFEMNVPIGFDSCSAPMFLKAVKDRKNYNFEDLSEPCESYLFSIYINVEGKIYPCSFLEGEEGYQGLDVLNCNDFIKDIWYHIQTIEFRKKLLDNIDENGCRLCPQFDLY